MKILQVCPRYPPHTGGVEKHVKEISERLVERGHDAVVHTADLGRDVDGWKLRNGIEVHRHRGFSPGGAFHVAPGLVSSVRRSDADVVHAHNYHSLPLFFAALGAGDTRFVATPHYHGGSASGVRDQLLSLYRPFGRWTVRRADAVVAVSEWEREQLRDDFNVDATVIPNGLNADRFADADPDGRERPYLLSVGRLEKYKGVQHAVRALPELEECDLVIAGSGPYRDELEEIVRSVDVDDRVEFLGYVDSERLPCLYAGAEAFLNLSSFEAYGMTVAEALTAGTPCVVRKQGALTDWLSVEGCVGVADTAPSAVAEAVTAVVSSHVAYEPTTWDGVVDRLEAVYGGV